MIASFLKRGCVYAVSLALVSLGIPAVSHARIIDTQTYLQAGQRDAYLASVRTGLNRAEVQERLVALGVDPARVEARLAGLTDMELERLAKQMEQMPAGGDLLAVVGIVFVVLLVLEVVGVIDIFKKVK